MLNSNSIINTIASIYETSQFSDPKVKATWMGIVARNPELQTSEVVIKAGLVEAKAAAKVADPERVVTLFVDPKTSIQHSRGCGVLYLLSEATKPSNMTAKKRWSLIERVIKHTADLTYVMPERTGDSMAFAVKLFIAIKPLVGDEYKTCDCRHHDEPSVAVRSCKHCGSSKVKSHSKTRQMCKACGRTSAK